jgi:hypothetical protein
MGGGGGGFGGRGPAPKRDLTTVVRKLELLTSAIQIELTEAQKGKLSEILAELDEAETLTDAQAKTHHDAILALIDDAQQTRMDAVGLPRSFGRGGGSGGGRGGRPGASSSGGSGGRPGGAQGGRGGGRPGPDANPLSDGSSAEALDKLLRRVLSQPAASDGNAQESAEGSSKPDPTESQPSDAEAAP